MWGVNGKNHFRPMGYHWLVALFLLSAEIAISADHVIVDGSVEVYNSNWETYLNSISYKLSDSGWIGVNLRSIQVDTGSILSYLSSFKSANHSDLSVISSFMTSKFDTGSTFDDVVQHLLGSFYINRFVTGGDYALQTVFPETMLYFHGHTNATVKLAVSDLGVQSRLDKIIDLLSSPAYFSSSPFTLASLASFGTLGDSFLYDAFLDALYAYWEEPSEYLNLDTLYQYFSIYGTELFDMFAHVDFSLLPEDLYNDFLDLYLIADPTGVLIYGVPYVDSYSRAYQQQYGTFYIREMVSNFVYSAVQGNVTNMNVLSQLISPSELSALFSQSGSSNAVMVTADYLSSQGLVTTNGVYQSEYSVPTNANELAEITTNDWGNSSYSAYLDSFNPESVENRVSRFDFETFFSDSLDGAIGSIDVSDVGDYVLEFGNLTLGDWFSYTIPSITIQHNETWLDFADKFFLGIKAFATCGFFLVLWRHLSEVT